MTQGPLLQMKGIVKSFGGVRALRGVDFEVDRGEVHALVGENGAGKSTLMKILGGVQARDSGEIILGGGKVSDWNPARAQESGIAVIHQELALCPDLSVAENVFVGRLPRRFRVAFDRARMHAETQNLLASIGFDIEPDVPVAALSTGQRQMVEITRAYSRAARLIVMDEPTSSLSRAETEALFAVIARLKARGISVIYISHRFDEIFRICDRVTVLRDGERAGLLSVAGATPENIIELMVGREVVTHRRQSAEFGAPVLEVRHLTDQRVIDDVSFTVRQGEIVGLAGLVGSGRTEIARAIFGIDRLNAGEIRLEGEPVQIRSARDAIQHGIGLVPEDRRLQGLILAMSVRENATLPNLDEISRFGVVSAGRERELVGASIKALAIKTPSMHQLVGNLSGGNQQKVVIAKWMMMRPKVLILDEPTRGIDVATKAEIHRIILELAQQGIAILLISSELPELVNLCDRVLVLRRGRLVASLDRGTDADEIMRLAAS